jgi:hypothetical protein
MQEGLMKTVRSLLCVLTCCVIASAAPVAVAVPITFSFTGIVTNVDSPLAVEFSLGESVVGSYTFESTTADIDPGDPTTGHYDNAITAFTATFGGDYTVTQGLDNDIFVADGLPGNDVYSLFLTNPTAPTVAGLSLGALSIGLIDTDSSVFSSDALPLTPPNLSDFEIDSSGTIYLGSPNQTMDFQLTSLTLVPEPTTLALATLGLVGIGYRRRKRA